jgi:hypothetical protein
LRESTTSDQARAEALFRKQEQLRDGQKAMAEYEAASASTGQPNAKSRIDALNHSAPPISDRLNGQLRQRVLAMRHPAKR